MFAKLFLAGALSFNLFGLGQQQHLPIDGLSGHPPFHIKHNSTTAVPNGLTPSQVKAAYNLSGNGSGTIAIVDAYDDPKASSDINKFSAQYGLPQCSSSNPCFAKHKMASIIHVDSGWALEESLDIEWAHAIAPGAKILLVEAKTASLTNLLAAVDYARKQPGVVAVSMSWGAGEFNGETSYDSHFTSTNGAAFFASSGDNGTGVSWPAVSPNVIGVGGTTLNMSGNTVTSELAWNGSGGGISAYEPVPAYQIPLAAADSSAMRGVPDVSYDADPATGFPVYDSTAYAGTSGWWQVGGTSAGAPQWAAIRALGGSGLTSANLYADAQSAYAAHFRDIVEGTNGSCNFVCQAGTSYDYVTGLGSPVTTGF